MPLHLYYPCYGTVNDFDKAFQPLIIDSNMFSVTLGEAREGEKQVMQAKSYISDPFDYSHEFKW